MSYVEKTENRFENRYNERYAPKPIFFVNPPIVVTMNEEMAHQIVEYLENTIRNGEQMPPSVFALKTTLQRDLSQAG
jgi:hypothetical protein